MSNHFDDYQVDFEDHSIVSDPPSFKVQINP